MFGGGGGRIMLHFSDYSSPRITHLIFCLSSSLFFSQSSQRNHHLPPFLFNFEFLIDYVYELLIIIWRWRSKSFIFYFRIVYVNGAILSSSRKEFFVYSQVNLPYNK